MRNQESGIDSGIIEQISQIIVEGKVDNETYLILPDEAVRKWCKDCVRNYIPEGCSFLNDMPLPCEIPWSEEMPCGKTGRELAEIGIGIKGESLD